MFAFKLSNELLASKSFYNKCFSESRRYFVHGLIICCIFQVTLFLYFRLLFINNKNLLTYERLFAGISTTTASVLVCKYPTFAYLANILSGFPDDQEAINYLSVFILKKVYFVFAAMIFFHSAFVWLFAVNLIEFFIIIWKI